VLVAGGGGEQSDGAVSADGTAVDPVLRRNAFVELAICHARHGTAEP